MNIADYQQGNNILKKSNEYRNGQCFCAEERNEFRKTESGDVGVWLSKKAQVKITK